MDVEELNLHTPRFVHHLLPGEFPGVVADVLKEGPATGEKLRLAWNEKLAANPANIAAWDEAADNINIAAACGMKFVD